MLRLYSISFSGVFRTHLNIYVGVFCKKPLTILTKKLHHRCSMYFKYAFKLYAVIGICVVALETNCQLRMPVVEPCLLMPHSMFFELDLNCSC